MRIDAMNWMQVEAFLGQDHRAVVPPLGMPVFPVLAYGIPPYFRADPGSVSLRVGLIEKQPWADRLRAARLRGGSRVQGQTEEPARRPV
jgi:hypothetical protein